MSGSVSHEELVQHALGRLGPRRREEVVALLAQDPALARTAQTIAAHLALYDRLPAAPEPPPFAALAVRLGTQQTARTTRWRALWPWSAAAALLLGAGVLLLGRGADETRAWGAAGQGLVVASSSGGAALLSAPDAAAEARVGERVRAVLDRGARLEVLSAEAVSLEAGRAWFEVRPGAFRVRTPHGDVEVLGTAFEVDVRSGLSVRVVEGRVRALGQAAGPGETLGASAPEAFPDAPGGFARRPRLALEVAGPPGADRLVEVRLVFEAPRNLAVTLPGPAPVASAAWLAFRRPDGTDGTLGLDLAGAGPAGPLPGQPLRLSAGERRTLTWRVPLPPGPAGSWRLSALYRPEGEAALASGPVPLEVP